MQKLSLPNGFLITMAMLPLALGACTAEPNSYYNSVHSQPPVTDGDVTIYSKTSTVAPPTSYYDAATRSTVNVGPTKVTTETVGPAYKTYEDDEGFWHTTYADVDSDDDQ